MSREDHQMKIRLPEELKARIDASASEAGRSLNAEIVARLEQSYRGGQSAEAKFEKALLQQRLDSMRSRYAAERIHVDRLADKVDRLVREDAKIEAIEAASVEYHDEAHELDQLGKQIEELRLQLQMHA